MMTHGTPWNVHDNLTRVHFKHQLYDDTWQSKPTYFYFQNIN